MTSITRFLTAALLCATAATAQAQTTPAASPAAFTGAVADQAQYKVIYQLNSDDPKIISMTLRNMKNALQDPRLKGKLQMELVAFAGGVTVFRKDQPYEAELRALQQQGVLLAQCLNTLQERNISKDALFPFISYVPTGNGELIIRQAQGWSLVHP